MTRHRAKVGTSKIATLEILHITDYEINRILGNNSLNIIKSQTDFETKIIHIKFFSSNRKFEKCYIKVAKWGQRWPLKAMSIK